MVEGYRKLKEEAQQREEWRRQTFGTCLEGRKPEEECLMLMLLKFDIYYFTVSKVGYKHTFMLFRYGNTGIVISN